MGLAKISTRKGRCQWENHRVTGQACLSAYRPVSTGIERARHLATSRLADPLRGYGKVRVADCMCRGRDKDAKLRMNGDAFELPSLGWNFNRSGGQPIFLWDSGQVSNLCVSSLFDGHRVAPRAPSFLFARCLRNGTNGESYHEKTAQKGPQTMAWGRF